MGANKVVNEMSSPGVSYHRVNHAAHYGNVAYYGHDLEEWTYAQAARLPRPDGIPSDAKYHVGFVDNGIQHWVYTRIAPMSGPCKRCESICNPREISKS